MRKLKSGHVEFVVDEAAVRQVFCENFGFPCHTFTGCSTIIFITNRGWYSRTVVASVMGD
jgi:hypothetical protein